MMFTKNQADEYILNNKNKINRTFKTEFHFSAEIGWINDPNGFCWFNGQYHLFYQFYPYSSIDGTKHWGHAVSQDLIKWEHLPVALAPDSPYDKDGCWSGTALVLDDKLYLIYTGVHDGKQEQCIAFSTNGITFEKYAGNPVIGEKNLAPGVNIHDFRDPKIIKKCDDLYCIIGANSKAVVYKSKNNSIYEWAYTGDLLGAELGVMWECPDYFEENGETVFIASICGENQQNKDKNKFVLLSTPTYFILENNSLENLPVKYKYFDELENGFDFYAPQTLVSPENKNIIIAWMYTFGESNGTDSDNLDHGWSHCLTLPREISVKDGKLYQNPVKAIEKYRQNEIVYENFSFDRNNFKLEKGMPYTMGNGIVNLLKLNGSKCCEIIISADIAETKKFTVMLPAGILELDKEHKLITFDRTNCGHDLRSDGQIKNDERQIRKMYFDFGDIINLRIFIDVSTVEIFIDDGEKVISSRFYPVNDTIDNYRIEFKSEGLTSIKEIKKYDIVM